MDWIHCNVCFVQLAPNISIYLTTCGHMYCNRCLEEGIKEKRCKMCKSSCSAIKLVPDMKPEIQDFFSDPEDIISKLSSVLSFQRKHRMRLTTYWIQSVKKFKMACEEVRRLNDLAHRMNDALKEVQKENKFLKKALIAKQSPQAVYSPFNMPLSPGGQGMSPTLTPSSHIKVKNKKSTPYTSLYPSNLVTPTRVSKQRSGYFSSQRSNASHRISSTTGLLTPDTPASAGSDDYKSEGYFSTSPQTPFQRTPNGMMYSTVHRI